eukprot:CAMPEP_0171207640 /NCGR_PEP_ID=MMETSP0790-20130122/27677_1 /TAXON_ID=2925 /ORGANISM="Alexandrium catenella, Strain OF101" /LENGTH=170 /DNA_ID=CAMNT_0011673211 /DNA_START=57 /DNA_END=569 /DNA_ORIENTATION=+
MAQALRRLPVALGRPVGPPLRAPTWPSRAAPCCGVLPRRFSSGATLRFSDTHEWIRIEEPGVGTVGISDFAQGKLGEVQAVGLPSVGARFQAKAEMVSIESVKTISSANAISDCEVVAVNALLEDKPSLINDSPEDEGWMLKVKYTVDIADYTMTREAYEAGVEDGSIPE